MGEPEVSAFLTALATDRRVSASTQNQAIAALLFLYGRVLGRDLQWMDDIVRAKRPERLPVVLTRAEVRRLLDKVNGLVALIVRLLYGSGFRLFEALELRVKDIDLEKHEIHVREVRAAKIEEPCCRERWSTACARSWPGLGISTRATSRPAPASWSSPTR
jgi:integrase